MSAANAGRMRIQGGTVTLSAQVCVNSVQALRLWLTAKYRNILNPITVNSIQKNIYAFQDHQ